LPKLQKFVEDGGILILSKQLRDQGYLQSARDRCWRRGLFKDMADINIPEFFFQSSLRAFVVMDQDGAMRKETFGLPYPDLKVEFQTADGRWNKLN